MALGFVLQFLRETVRHGARGGACPLEVNSRKPDIFGHFRTFGTFWDVERGRCEGRAEGRTTEGTEDTEDTEREEKSA